MRRGTTPTLTFTPTIDVSGYARVVLTIVGDRRTLDIEKDRMQFTGEGTTFTVTLTQDETLTLGGTCEAQLRVASLDGSARASEIVTFDVGRILRNGRLEVADG